MIKNYLEQAFYLDKQVNAKLEQLNQINALIARLAESKRLDMHVFDKAEKKIMDLEREINAEIDKLVETKQNIQKMIATVQDPQCRTLLELRYLNFLPWEEIAEKMSYELRHVYRIHQKALKELENMSLNVMVDL